MKSRLTLNKNSRNMPPINIDADVYELFIKKNPHRYYAKKKMKPDPIDK